MAEVYEGEGPFSRGLNPNEQPYHVVVGLKRRIREDEGSLDLHVNDDPSDPHILITEEDANNYPVTSFKMVSTGHVVSVNVFERGSFIGKPLNLSKESDEDRFARGVRIANRALNSARANAKRTGAPR